MDETMATPQALERLGWDKNKLRRWVATLNLDPPKDGRGTWRFAPEALAVLEQVKTMQEAGHSDRSIRLRVTRAPEAPGPAATFDPTPIVEALGRLAGDLPDTEEVVRLIVGELTPHLERRARHADELLQAQRELTALARELAAERERTAQLTLQAAMAAQRVNQLEATTAEQARRLAAPPPPPPGVWAAITAAIGRVFGHGAPPSSHQ